MGQLSPILRNIEGGKVSFWCPGCDEAHAITVNRPDKSPNWGWNGDAIKPTFTPSILVRGGDYLDELVSDENPHGWIDTICHSFVTDGNIQFLGDCTHALANKTVSLPE